MRSFAFQLVGALLWVGMARVITSFDSVVLAAIAREMEALVGSRVARVLQPAADEIAIELRSGAEAATVLCSIHPQWARVHLSSRIEGGDLSPFAQLLRSRLERAQLQAIRQPPFERVLTLTFEAIDGPYELHVEIMGRHSNLILTHKGTIAGSLKPVPRSKSSVREVLPGRPYLPPPQDRLPPPSLSRDTLAALLHGSSDQLTHRLTTAVLGLSPPLARELAIRAGMDPAGSAGAQLDHVPRLWAALHELASVVRDGMFSPTLYLDGSEPVGYSAFPLTHLNRWQARKTARMSEAVEVVVVRRAVTARFDERRNAVLSVVSAAAARLRRTRTELEQALTEAQRAEMMKQQGELLLAYASQISAGASEATLPGFDGTPVTITLDPTRTPVQNAQRIFKRYAKVRAAGPEVQARYEQATADLVYLESVRTLIEYAGSDDDLFDLRQELITGGYLRERGSRARRVGKTAGLSAAAQPRTFTLDSGEIVLVGRTNLENDRLTFKVASPGDLWFHARGVPGAHAILRTTGRTPSERAIHRAAAIAAYFSQARGSTSTAVDYTERRNVRKPKGSKPGFVVYERERTVYVKPALPNASDE